MLFICLDCRRIVGCAEKGATIQKECEDCSTYDLCKLETPIGVPVGRQVFFIKFKKSCEEHHHK